MFFTFVVSLSMSMFLDNGESKKPLSEIEVQFKHMRTLADMTTSMDDVYSSVDITVYDLVQVEPSLWLKYKMMPYKGPYGTVFIVPFESIRKFNNFLIVGKILYKEDSQLISSTFLEWEYRYIYKDKIGN